MVSFSVRGKGNRTSRKKGEDGGVITVEGTALTIYCACGVIAAAFVVHQVLLRESTSVSVAALRSTQEEAS